MLRGIKCVKCGCFLGGEGQEGKAGKVILKNVLVRNGCTTQNSSSSKVARSLELVILNLMLYSALTRHTSVLLVSVNLECAINTDSDTLNMKITSKICEHGTDTKINYDAIITV